MFTNLKGILSVMWPATKTMSQSKVWCTVVCFCCHASLSPPISVYLSLIHILILHNKLKTKRQALWSSLWRNQSNSSLLLFVYIFLEIETMGSVDTARQNSWVVYGLSLIHIYRVLFFCKMGEAWDGVSDMVPTSMKNPLFYKNIFKFWQLKILFL